jgi:hypothetical protein
MFSNNYVLEPSPTRQYVLPVLYQDKDGKRRMFFKKFFLPYTIENTCVKATWYFYNRLDTFSAGGSAFPFEMYEHLVTIPQVQEGQLSLQMGGMF